jgi:hypothetical protein
MHDAASAINRARSDRGGIRPVEILTMAKVGPQRLGRGRCSAVR